MYDLDLLRAGAVFGACEVTSATDGESVAVWKHANGGDRWTERSLRGGWLVSVTPQCMVKNLRRSLPGVLERLEQPGSAPGIGEVDDLLTTLGVVSVEPVRTDHPGTIYVTISRHARYTGGWVADTGNGLVSWSDKWIAEPGQADNLAKLRSAAAVERHLFVVLPGFTTAPFSAADLLMRPDAPLPEIAPTLPVGLTHLWVMSTWNIGDLFHWSPTGWQRFAKAGVANRPTR